MATPHSLFNIKFDFLHMFSESLFFSNSFFSSTFFARKRKRCQFPHAFFCFVNLQQWPSSILLIRQLKAEGKHIFLLSLSSFSSVTLKYVLKHILKHRFQKSILYWVIYLQRAFNMRGKKDFWTCIFSQHHFHFENRR